MDIIKETMRRADEMIVSGEIGREIPAMPDDIWDDGLDDDDEIEMHDACGRWDQNARGGMSAALHAGWNGALRLDVPVPR